MASVDPVSSDSINVPVEQFEEPQHSSTKQEEAKALSAEVPQWAQRMMQCAVSVPAQAWTTLLTQAGGEWHHIPLVCVCTRLARQNRWVSAEMFAGIAKRVYLHKHHLDDVANEVEDSLLIQSMERFICTEVLLALRFRRGANGLSRNDAVLVTQHMASHLKGAAFQRVAQEYTWDRVVFDTIPFLVDYADKLMNEPSASRRIFVPSFPCAMAAHGAAEDAEESGRRNSASNLSTGGIISSLSRSLVGTTTLQVYAWHLYTSLEQGGRIEAVRAVATESLTKGSVPLISCCRTEFRSGIEAAEVAAVLVVEHHQGGSAARRVDDRGYTALHYAAQRDHDDRGRLIRVLVSAGISMNAQGHDGFTPLALGCGAEPGKRAPARVVDEILDHDADMSISDLHGMKPLHHAVLHGHCDLVTLLRRHGADMNAADRMGFAGVHLAASAGSLPMLSLLASYGAKLGTRNTLGLTPLRIAMDRGHTDVAVFIFETRNWLAARWDLTNAAKQQEKEKETQEEEQQEKQQTLSISQRTLGSYNATVTLPAASTAIDAVVNFEPEPEPVQADTLVVLRDQLPDMKSAKSVNLSGLGLNHVLPELGHLSSATRIDLRSNPLHTLWWLPWWYCVADSPVFSKWFGYLLSIVFALIWINISLLGFFLSSRVWIALFHNTAFGFSLGIGHFVILFLFFSLLVPLLYALVHKKYLQPYRRMEAQRPLLETLSPFQPLRVSNLLAILKIFFSIMQVFALTVSSSALHVWKWPETIVAPIRALVLDIPTVDPKILLTIAVALVCVLRLWVEFRAHLPHLWAADRLLAFCLSISFIPCSRTLLRTILCATSSDMPSASELHFLTPAARSFAGQSCFASACDLSLLAAAVGAVIMLFYIVLFSEAFLQCRDQSLQLRLDPGALLYTRLTMLLLVLVDLLCASAPILHTFTFTLILSVFVLLAMMFVAPHLLLHGSQWMWAMAALMVWVPSPLVLMGHLVHADDELAHFIVKSVFVCWSIILVFAFAIACFVSARLRKSLAREQHQQRLQSVLQLIKLHPSSSEILDDLRQGLQFSGVERKYDIRTWLLEGTHDANQEVFETLFETARDGDSTDHPESID